MKTIIGLAALAILVALLAGCTIPYGTVQATAEAQKMDTGDEGAFAFYAKGNGPPLTGGGKIAILRAGKGFTGEIDVESGKVTIKRQQGEVAVVFPQFDDKPAAPDKTKVAEH